MAKKKKKAFWRRRSTRVSIRAAKTRVYVVQPGDSLSKIAKKQLGDASRWREIAELNKIKDPDLIRPGQELIVAAKRPGVAGELPGEGGGTVPR
jgi:nucleoid-associated protein YgaU